MCTKVLAFLTLAAIANGNDVIVGLKTDGRKFFDENRQANPALWRQMDNVTIKAPENEVIRRIVITDLRPEKDGDVKVVEGGEGQKNVTIELKSPTVLRGYEFHIEVYSTPEENTAFTNDQKSTTEILQDDSTTSISTNPTTASDTTTSKMPDLSTDRDVPTVLSSDEVKESERQGRNAKTEENNTMKDTTELTSTTIKIDVSTAPIPQHSEMTTENSNEKRNDTPKKLEFGSTNSPIPLYKNLNINPSIPALSGKDTSDDKLNVSTNDETRHVRDTEKEKLGETSQTKLNFKPTNILFESSTEKDQVTTTTELIDAIPVEEKSENNSQEDIADTSNTYTFDKRKYTSVTSSKLEHPENPIDVKDADKSRNVRETDEEQQTEESFSTTISSESITTDINDEASTVTTDDCVTTEVTNIVNPVNIGKENEQKPSQIPIYVNNRQWNQRFNNPTFQTKDDQNSPDVKVNPAVLNNDQTTSIPETIDAERLGNDYKPSPDHMETTNPKISVIGSRRDRNMTPVISTQ